MILVLLCVFDIVTAEPTCSSPIPAEFAIALEMVKNKDQPFDLSSTITPPTIFPADHPPPGWVEKQRQDERKYDGN